MSNPTYQLPILIYDSECILCKRFKEALERLPLTKKIQMVSIYDDQVFAEFTQLNQDQCFDLIHLIDENKKIYQGPEVIEYLIDFAPGVSNLKWLLKSDAGKKTIDFFYQTANKLRNSILNPCPRCKKNHHKHPDPDGN